MSKFKDRSLYLVITEEHCKGRGALDVAEAAIRGGVDIIQMREKDKSSAELTDLGRKLAALCNKSGVTFIVNDDPNLAKEVNADGVHLGQKDLKAHTVEKARKIVGKDKMIGVSTRFFEQALQADSSDCDYIAYGPVFRTEIKDEYAGTGDIEKILKAVSKPVVFIGGITLSNVDELLKKGAKHFSMIRSITQAPDVEIAMRQFRDKIDPNINRKAKNG